MAYLALEIVVPGEQKPARYGESNRGDTADWLADLRLC
jgi:hypothetical protein